MGEGLFFQIHVNPYDILELFKKNRGESMVRKFKSNDIFKPGTFPTHTYIIRKSEGDISYEKRLELALETPGFLTSIVGPSKTGKTVLCEKVLGNRMILLSGGDFRNDEDFWTIIARKLEIPIEKEIIDTQENELQGTAKGGGKAGVFFSEVKVETAGSVKRTNSYSLKGRQLIYKDQVLEQFTSRDLVLVLDDFHYIDRKRQLEIAYQLKDAIRKELKTVVTSLPHRADDAIRQNPDLNGRMSFINIEPWTDQDLEKIPEVGFGKLDVTIPQPFAERLAKESLSSPQLIQDICLNLARELAVDENDTVHLIEHEQVLFEAFKKTTLNMAYKDVVKTLQAGPPTRGQTRRKYQLIDGMQADIYGAIFEAIAKDPPIISMTVEDLKTRVNSLLASAQQKIERRKLSDALRHIQLIIESSGQLFQVLEWKDNQIYILDPYFLFFLRWGRTS